jgi:lactobin A/cerein 7B family class IIb bacteriocin
MNLENLNLVELNAQEIKETEGGILQILVEAAALWGALYGAGYAIGQALR